MRHPFPICSCGKCFRIGDLDSYQDLAPHALRRGWVRDGDEWTCTACRRKKGRMISKKLAGLVEDLRKAGCTASYASWDTVTDINRPNAALGLVGHDNAVCEAARKLAEEAEKTVVALEGAIVALMRAESHILDLKAEQHDETPAPMFIGEAIAQGKKALE